MFVISIAALRHNAALLRQIKEGSGCKVALALKGFSCWKAFKYINDELDGCCASGLWEGLLARDHFQKHVLTYSPAYDDEDIGPLCELSHHLDFNSLSQWFRFKDRVMQHPRYLSGELKCGLRINPEYSTNPTPLYDPCVPGSRLGVTKGQLAGADLTGLSGLHFHTLCEQNADDLEATLEVVYDKFGHLLQSSQFTYLNMGGGHWVTKPFYDRLDLIRLAREAIHKYKVEVWIEPGEAAAIHTGVLRATVMDIVESGDVKNALLSVSATAHMPDVLEMPYRPDVFLVDKQATTLSKPCVTFEGESYSPALEAGNHLYRLGGPTCLAGDKVGDFAFPRALKVGDILVFDDMAHYTMVKTTMFNGVKHPPIVLQHEDGSLETIREFTYEDFRDRLC